MGRVIQAVAKFATDENGATMAEYVMMAFLIAVMAFVAVTTLGSYANSKFNSVAPAFAAS